MAEHVKRQDTQHQYDVWLHYQRGQDKGNQTFIWFKWLSGMSLVYIAADVYTLRYFVGFYWGLSHLIVQEVASERPPLIFVKTVKYFSTKHHCF